MRHQTSQHGGAQNKLQKFNVKLQGENSQLREEYDNFRAHILAPHRRSRNGTVYNFPTNDLEGGMQEVTQHLNSIYSSESNAFRVNVALGMILRDLQTGETRYFIPYENEMLFDTPQAISNRRDLNRVLSRLRHLDVREYVNNRKPKSSLKPQFVTNLVYYVYKTNFPLGAVFTLLPDVIRNKKCIKSLDIRSNGKLYSDNLCLFRCLVYHRQKKIDESVVKEYFTQWHTINQLKCSEKSFKGVSIHELPMFEDVFKVNIHMYECAADESDVIIPRFLSNDNHSETMFVNLYQNHTSYITNFFAYSGKIQCPSCSRLFSRKNMLRNHMRICSNTKKCFFPGGFFQSQKTVFEELEDFGVFVPENLRLYPFFAVFDFEAMLVKSADRVSEKLKFTYRHHPISVSINSNVAEYTEPIHHVSANLEDLLKNMLSSLQKIAVAAEAKTREKLSFVFDILNERLSQCAPKKLTASQQLSSQDIVMEAENVGFDNDTDHDDDNIENAITHEDLAFIDDNENERISDDYSYQNPYMHPHSTEK